MIVLLRDELFVHQKYDGNLAVILKVAPPSVVAQEGREKKRAYFMLVSVDQATKAKPQG